MAEAVVNQLEASAGYKRLFFNVRSFQVIDNIWDFRRSI